MEIVVLGQLNLGIQIWQKGLELLFEIFDEFEGA